MFVFEPHEFWSLVGLLFVFHTGHFIWLMFFEAHSFKISSLYFGLYAIGCILAISAVTPGPFVPFWLMWFFVLTLETLFAVYLLFLLQKPTYTQGIYLSPEEKAQHRETLETAIEALERNLYDTYFKCMARCTPQEELHILKKLETEFMYNPNLSNFNKQCRIFAERLLRVVE
jgi:hypothetical protein